VLDVINYRIVVGPHQSQGARDTVVGGAKSLGVRFEQRVVEPQLVAPAAVVVGELPTETLSGVAESGEWSLLLVPVAICVALVVYASLFLN